MPVSPQSPAGPASPAVDLYCPRCGYSLRGISSERCPECGAAIEWHNVAQPRTPWSHRRQIGRVRAYLRTVGLAIFDSRKLATHAASPVSYADAQRFRWITILLIFVPMVVGAWFMFRAKDRLEWIIPRIPADLAQMSRGGTVALMTTGLLLAVILITGIASYFFHPRSLPMEQQNRAVALSYYACANLLAAIWVPLLGVAVLVLTNLFDLTRAFFTCP